MQYQGGKYVAAFYLAILLFTGSKTVAQCSFAGDVVLDTQSKLENFAVITSGCGEIEANVSISFGNSDKVTNLSSLTGITKIKGSLFIGGLSDLPSLNGIQNLTTISGDFTLTDLTLITDLTGLTNLTSIGGDLKIISNPGLQTLDGLGPVSAIDGALEISFNPKLTNINRFSGITTLNNLVISYCPMLTSLAGLENLHTINGSMSVKYNTILADLDGLTGITSINGDIQIAYNPIISNLLFLEAVESVSGDLSIVGNSELLDLNNLLNIKTVAGGLEIWNNSKLTSLVGLDELLSVGNSLSISGNPLLSTLSGMESLKSLGGLNIANNPKLVTLSGLESVTSLSGHMYIDNNVKLVSLSGLQNITSEIDGFNIVSNPVLVNIDAMANISKVIDGCIIFQNMSLSNCSIRPICDLIADNPSWVIIENNTGNCETFEDAESACSALPVTLFNFLVKKEEKKAILYWASATESNSYQYVVERSDYSGKNWEKIGSVMAKGESMSRLNYTFTDISPLSQNNLYRLKMVDLDGSYTYSKIVSVTFETLSIVFFPNPANDKVFLAGLSQSSLLTVTNDRGEVVIKNLLEKKDHIDVSKLGPGTYIFGVDGQTAKVVIKH